MDFVTEPTHAIATPSPMLGPAPGPEASFPHDDVVAPTRLPLDLEGSLLASWTVRKNEVLEDGAGNPRTPENTTGRNAKPSQRAWRAIAASGRWRGAVKRCQGRAPSGATFRAVIEAMLSDVGGRISLENCFEPAVNTIPGSAQRSFGSRTGTSPMHP